VVIKMADLLSDNGNETLLILASSTIIFSNCTLLCNGGLKKKGVIPYGFEVTCSFITNSLQRL